MVSGRRTSPSAGHCRKSYYRTIPSNHCGMAHCHCSGYGMDVWSVQRFGQIAHRTTTCRFYSEDPSSDRTFTVPSAVKASASIGSPLLPPNAPPLARSYSGSFATITLLSRAAKKPLRRTHSTSFGCPIGRGLPGSPGRQCWQGRQGFQVRSPKS